MLTNVGHNHLVPVVKGAVDLNKGLILRTYHVKPEKLQELLKQYTKLDPVIAKLPHEKGIRRLLASKDLSPLREAFSYNSDNWHHVVKRYDNAADILTHNTQKQLLFQNMYGFVTTNNPVLLPTIKNHFKKSHKGKFVVIEHDEQHVRDIENKKIEQKVSAIREQVQRMVRSDKVVEGVLQIQPVKAFSQNNILKPNNSGVIKKEDIDTGTLITRTIREESRFTSITLGRDISKFVNYLNPNPTRVATLVQQCSQMNDTKTPECSNNFSFPLSTYTARPKFWKDRLLYDYLESVRTDSEYNDTASALLHALVLRKLDKKKTEDVFLTYMTDDLYFVLRNQKNVHSILESDELDIYQKQSVLASMDAEQIRGSVHVIENYMQRMHRENNTDAALSILGSGYITAEAHNVYMAALRMDQSFFNIKTIVQQTFDVQNKIQRPDFRYFLLQILGATLAKTHYIPYRRISDIRGGVFSPTLVKHLFKYYKFREHQGFLRHLKENKPSYEKTYIVGIKQLDTPTPVDGQVFIRLEPFRVFDIVEPGDEGKYLVSGVVSKEHVVSIQGTQALIFNPIKTVKF